MLQFSDKYDDNDGHDGYGGNDDYNGNDNDTNDYFFFLILKTN